MERLLKVVATVVVVMVVVGVGVEANKCDIDCSGHAFGDKVPDPTNCTNYYYCLGDGIPGEHPTPCDDGEEFNATLAKCVTGSGCTALCDDTSGSCNLLCNGTVSYVAVVGQCNQFKICLPNGPSEPQYCHDPTPYFDGESCVSDESVCCDSVCTVQCSGPDTTVPDPTDCTRFYFCKDEGKPDEDTLFKCPSGNYDMASGICSSSAPCNVLCKDGGSNDTSHTTPSSNSTPSSGCVQSMTCPSKGYFPACSDCNPQYFACDFAGNQGILSECTNGNVFNPNPARPFCVLPSNCPYYG